MTNQTSRTRYDAESSKVQELDQKTGDGIARDSQNCTV